MKRCKSYNKYRQPNSESVETSGKLISHEEDRKRKEVVANILSGMATAYTLCGSYTERSNSDE